LNTGGKTNEYTRNIHLDKAITLPVKRTKNSSKPYNQILGNLPHLQISPNSIRQTHNWSNTTPARNNDITVEVDNTNIVPTNITCLKTLKLYDQLRQELQQIQRQIQKWQSTEIYTDGSLEKYDNGQVKMRIGGIIINTDTLEETKFKGRCEGFPSSTRAELMAILTALTLLNPSTATTIITDSQSAIHAIQSKSPLKQKIAKGTNILTILLIRDKIKERTATTSLQKIKAHTGDKNNE